MCCQRVNYVLSFVVERTYPKSIIELGWANIITDQIQWNTNK